MFLKQLDDSGDADAYSTAPSYSGSCGENITYSFNKTTGTLTLSGSGAMYDYVSGDGDSSDDSVAPWARMWGETITTGIAYHAGYRDDIKSLSISEEITHIGDYAFWNCTALYSLSLPDSVKSIGTGAFGTCYGLTVLDLGKVETIGEEAFYSAVALKIVNIPDSVTTIGNGAFLYNTYFASVTIGSGVTSIGENAFFSGLKLGVFEVVNLSPLNITEGSYGITPVKNLYNATDATNATVKVGEDGFITGSAEGTPYLLGFIGKATSIVLPDKIDGSVYEIGAATFAANVYVQSVTIPSGITSIPMGAFVGCEAITSVNIPDTVTTIGEEAFEGYVFYDTDGNSLENTSDDLSGHIFKFVEVEESGNRKMVEQNASTATFEFADGKKQTVLFVSGTEVIKPANTDGDKCTTYTWEVSESDENSYKEKAVYSHELIQTGYTAATCTGPGTNGYWTCSECKKVFRNDKTTDTTVAAEVLPIAEHEYVSHDAVDAKCETPGNSAYFTCKNCTKVFDSDKKETTMANVTIAATGHKEEIIPADDSYTAGKRCSVCGYIIEAPKYIEKDSDGNDVSMEKYTSAEEKVGDDTVKTELKKETDSGKAKEVSTEIDISGTSVTDDSVTKAVEQLNKTVEKYSSEGSEKKTVTISITSEEKKTEVSISKKSLETIKDAGAETEIKGNLGILKISQDAAATLISKGSNVSLSAGTADKSVLTEEQSEKVGNASLFKLSAAADGSAVSKFGGNITVTLPYALSEGKTAGDVVVYYINDDGEFVQNKNCSYADGYVTFTTDHFSYWAITDTEIAEEESQIGVVVIIALVFVVVLAAVIMRMGMKTE